MASRVALLRRVHGHGAYCWVLAWDRLGLAKLGEHSVRHQQQPSSESGERQQRRRPCGTAGADAQWAGQ